MSCHIVSKRSIDSIANMADWFETSMEIGGKTVYAGEDLSAFGQALVDVNVDSVNIRFDAELEPWKYEAPGQWDFAPTARSAWEAIKELKGCCVWSVAYPELCTAMNELLVALADQELDKIWSESEA